jgi:hypothetical protein
MARSFKRGLISGVATVAAIALIASAGAAISQTKTPDKNATGQSDRTEDPKRVEPESQAHNADKPKDKKQAEREAKDTKKKN